MRPLCASRRIVSLWAIEQIESLRQEIRQGLDRIQLQQKLAPGAARNALDCAFWDIQAKRSPHRVWELLGLPSMQALTTAYTLSLDNPERMYEAAVASADRPLLKLKLAGEGDLERVQSVRKGAPNARLIVDANEAGDASIYRRPGARVTATWGRDDRTAFAGGRGRGAAGAGKADTDLCG